MGLLPLKKEGEKVGAGRSAPDLPLLRIYSMVAKCQFGQID